MMPANTGNRTPANGGFTLLEVLVALAVLAIALSALVKAAGENAADAAYLRDKTFAHWVAMNELAEFRLQNKWPAVGTSSGTARLAGRDWSWTAAVESTPDAYVRRLEVTVRRDAAAVRALDTVAGYLPRTTGAGAGK